MGLIQRTVELDAELVAEIETDGRDLNAALNQALQEWKDRRIDLRSAAAEGNRLDPEGAAERARAWKEENAEALAFHAERIEREGVFGEEWRSW